MTIERRRAAAAKAFERARRLGLEIDPDPAFAALIQSWINGELTMPEARERYLASLKDRTQRATGGLLGSALPEIAENETTAAIDDSAPPSAEAGQPPVLKRRRRRTRAKSS
ncbi:hypothetical protein HGP14_11785 [Rhizobium sp. P32RR-XVIII]|uniref:hypothetical protein n=1 Tax=Rhizobium sp. P32RR-XVIII TaxID=2726738 RepID=UPI001456A92D|nr:hypothetical protein [Rhizobium sp. P32RR-XVIII]NLS04034.1 hypothetical protein [Rhizobium sp. P32RR-XVIII]